MSLTFAVPVPTYFTLGRNELPDSIKGKVGAGAGEVTDNLVFLGELPASRIGAPDSAHQTGRSGVFTTAQGLKVGFLGGRWDQAAYDAGDASSGEVSPTRSSVSPPTGADGHRMP